MTVRTLSSLDARIKEHYDLVGFDARYPSTLIYSFINEAYRSLRDRLASDGCLLFAEVIEASIATAGRSRDSLGTLLPVTRFGQLSTVVGVCVQTPRGWRKLQKLEREGSTLQTSGQLPAPHYWNARVTDSGGLQVEVLPASTTLDVFRVTAVRAWVELTQASDTVLVDYGIEDYLIAAAGAAISERDMDAEALAFRTARVTALYADVKKRASNRTLGVTRREHGRDDLFPIVDQAVTSAVHVGPSIIAMQMGDDALYRVYNGFRLLRNRQAPASSTVQIGGQLFFCSDGGGNFWCAKANTKQVVCYNVATGKVIKSVTLTESAGPIAWDGKDSLYCASASGATPVFIISISAGVVTKAMTFSYAALHVVRDMSGYMWLIHDVNARANRIGIDDQLTAGSTLTIPAGYYGRCAVDDRGKIYLPNYTDGNLYYIDTNVLGTIWSVALGGEPICALFDGKDHMYVALRTGFGVARVHVDTFAVTSSITGINEPRSLALDNDGHVLVTGKGKKLYAIGIDSGVIEYTDTLEHEATELTALIEA